MSGDKSEILQGTLDLMVLKTLDAMGPLHGYGIARRIEQISEEALQIKSGHNLRLSGAPGAKALDLGCLGDIRQQPKSEILYQYQSRV